MAAKITQLKTDIDLCGTTRAQGIRLASVEDYVRRELMGMIQPETCRLSVAGDKYKLNLNTTNGAMEFEPRTAA